MHKKNIYLLLGFLFIFTACKKGDEDPFLSLLSRKERVAGDWKMDALTFEHITYLFSSQNSINTTGNSTQINTVAVHDMDTSYIDQEVISYTLEISKDGNWKKIIESNVTSVEIDQDPFGGVRTDTYHELNTESGTWAFMNKTKGVYKNKERINLSMLNSVRQNLGGVSTFEWNNSAEESTTTSSDGYTNQYTYTNGEKTIVYDITMLKSKEMKWVRENEQESTVNGNLQPRSKSLESIYWVAQ